ncbi:sigma-70 family RNA polymerase sigma factor [Streptomyces sp. ID05-04B]|uniref:sigma-70 family RNA polymerase sigma factor n=1 Tax=unclassified Streptomyces TaxID=2593676 RepID=UPI000D1A78ED|nr:MULTISPECIES: sigma-70 family RNA polymerase sigma factor [unclassified Streptomyces]AVV47001.1 RNA polymerase [Streptomyces sp. P3]MDX5567640.1 sigma-70 family RNA polymerase sigma factor [Streptomyces sp. ID05-04B]
MSERHTIDATELVRAARAGDQAAQDALVGAYLPLVYNIVGRALNGSVDVDDVVQDTMLRALDSLGALRSPESFRSWLVAIAMNQVRAHFNRLQPAQGGMEEADEVADPGADFVDLTIVQLQLSGQRQETARATRWLEPDDRGLLSLWWLECAGELTRAEIADALSLTPPHTAVRVQRMKAQLEAARVVVRALDAQPPCAELRGALADFDGRPSALWRKRIARHARGCARCSGLWSGLLPAEGLLAGLALVAVSSALLVRTPGAADTVALAASAAPASADGDPSVIVRKSRRASGDRTVSRSAARRRRRTRRRAVGTAVVAACVAGGGLYYFGTQPGTGSRESTAVQPADDALISDRPSPDAGRTSASPSPSASVSASPSASKSPAASASPSARPSRSAPVKAPAKPAAGAGRSASKTPFTQSGPSDRESQVIALVNKERAAAGCGPLTGDALLRKSAQGHSDDMAARDFFDHTNPDGADPGRRITAAGYRWSTYGENIAKGQQTAQSVMTSWMNSPGHRANILNCDFKNIGVGIHDGAGGPWWTQNFGAKL